MGLIESVPPLSALSILSNVEPELYRGATLRQYRDGEVVLTEGGPADRLVVLVRGGVEVRAKDTWITNRWPIRLIGEQAMIDETTRSATVIARGPVATYEFDLSAFRRLMNDCAFRKNLIDELNWKLREATSERSWLYANEEALFGAFRAHVSPEVLQELLRAGHEGRPRQAEVVALFADIRGFTTKSTSMTPDRLTADLSAYFETAVAVVHEHRGMVDKFIGDGVMALWGYAPHAEDPERAVAAAHDLVVRASRLSLDGEPMKIGVGLESGIVTLGVVGPEGKRQFTAIGPSVNLAARLQEETKTLGASIAIGPDLAARLPERWRERLGPEQERRLRGVDTPVRIRPMDVKEG